MRQADVTAKPIRVTLVVLDILAAIDRAGPEDPPWGLRLCEETGYGSGTTYPALDKLERAGWITSTWEEQPPDRPRRRFYVLTGDGREAWKAALSDREERAAPSLPTRRASWRRPRETGPAFEVALPEQEVSDHDRRP